MKMFNQVLYKILFNLIIFFPLYSVANEMIFDDFKNNPSDRWEYIADTVMGGVSKGNVTFINKEKESYAKMVGNVSLENNGGFIQFRREIKNKFNEGIKGIKIRVRGNELEYYIHIRTKGTVLPWQYYQAVFLVEKTWEEKDILFESFKRSGIMLSKKFKSKNITSIAVVAFGKEHLVDIEVDSISFY